MTASLTSAGSESATGYVRLTVHGASQRADVVLPADQPTALLVPRILELVDPSEGTEGRRFVLATLEGRVIAPAESLASAGVLDGTILRLTTTGEMPPEPLVHDLAETVESSDVPGRWEGSAKRAVVGLIGTAAVVAGLLQWSLTLAPDRAVWALAGSAVGLLLLAALVGRGSDPVAAAGPIALGGVSFVPFVALADGDSGVVRAVRVVVLLALVLLVLGVFTRQLRAAVTAAILGLALAGLWWGVWLLTGDNARTGAVLAVVVTFVVGTLPRLALNSAEIFRLDAMVAGDADVPRGDAGAAVAAAHWTLAAAVAVSSAFFGMAGWTLGRHGLADAWLAGVFVVSIVAWSLRARLFPLAAERLAMWGASVASLAGAAAGAVEFNLEHRGLLALGAVAIGLVVLVTPMLRLSDYNKALLRQLNARAEAVCVVASIPLVIGAFGVYRDLLETF
ncbi:type VII secretion integral membrane protein EccD [Knoellia remsis]|uniref:Type VII secretion integral membrane protein EccD n=1 Tax=Knoellia remsis TaxID=407159 RepID=A0A2T0UY23_9MICO|nr:EsaB/YukD family protein [Knoellia remsis]PRY62833.1 type VII secretion integral membrane protein EccD [Knoellia remsis]